MSEEQILGYSCRDSLEDHHLLHCQTLDIPTAFRMGVKSQDITEVKVFFLFRALVHSSVGLLVEKRGELTSVRSERQRATSTSLSTSLAPVAKRSRYTRLDIPRFGSLNDGIRHTRVFSLQFTKYMAVTSKIWTQKQTIIAANPDWYLGASYEKKSCGPMMLPRQ